MKVEDEVTQVLDSAWRKIDAARTELVYVQGLVQNTTLQNRFGLLIDTVRRLQYTYMELVCRWDMIPEARRVRKLYTDTKAAQALTEDIDADRTESS